MNTPVRAMLLDSPREEAGPWRPLRLGVLPEVEPSDDELLVTVTVCAVCRTDLDLAEGRLRAPHYPVVPGHQVVGRVARTGANAAGFREGDRVGVAWINWADGVCARCREGNENLCARFRATGCDVNGGYADAMVVPAAFAHHVPAALRDADAAPLLCAGAIGWRSLRLANLRDGEPLGLTGFGASAHLVLQLARRRYPSSPVYVFARDNAEREFAKTLGAAWAGDTGDAPPEPLSAIIDTTPAWKPVLASLRHLRPGGRLVINAIRKSNRDRGELLGLDYATDLWMEREIKSVANVTRADVREMLDAAVDFSIRATVGELPLESANDALEMLRQGGGTRGARVLRIAPS